MSAETVQQIVARAVADSEFRGLLFRNAAQALAGYELSESEAATLKGLTPESLDKWSLQLEERLSRSTLNGLDAGQLGVSGKYGVDIGGNF